ncbi:hypothetical protein E0Z10_g9882 [Xylaria hypoxylon]|uniref:Carrier domain-containing protein n=1 Tax=Xylaria hypoxylon TaxID=37992 RepID=A0A4Z0YHW4_9PEZI|nr:hypothetical protein E0Z10_g9882 [Xylaria hypoxylon]
MSACPQADCLRAGGISSDQVLLPSDADFAVRQCSYLSRSAQSLQQSCIVQPRSSLEVAAVVRSLVAARIPFAEANVGVAGEESLVGFLRHVSTSFPPIRGVIHAANILAPKVAATRNLHKHLPRDLDFLVLISSIIGVTGHLSQANYATANAFEDALACHRAALGLAAAFRHAAPYWNRAVLPNGMALPSSENTSLDPTVLLIRALSNGISEVSEALGSRPAAIFNVAVESVDLDSTVSTLGVDSLVSVELRNWLASAGKAKLSIFELLQSPSLKQVAGLVIKRSALSPN